MASGQREFASGVQAYKQSNYALALKHFNEAIALGLSTVQVYDSRAAAHDKLGNIKDALSDAKKCITIDSKAVQGYVRASKLFLKVGKYENAINIVSKALECVVDSNESSSPGSGGNKDKRRSGFLQLQAQILAEQKGRLEEQDLLRRKKILSQCHPSKLPAELLTEVFIHATTEDPIWGVIPQLKLCMICRQWRRLILTNPIFWGQLTLGHVRPIPKATRWKERSQGRIYEVNLTEHLDEETAKLALDVLGVTPFNYIRVLKAHTRHTRTLEQRRGSLFDPARIKELEVVGSGTIGRPGEGAHGHAAHHPNAAIYPLVCPNYPQDRIPGPLERIIWRNIDINSALAHNNTILHTSIKSLTELTLVGMSVPADPATFIHILDRQTALRKVTIAKPTMTFPGLTIDECWEGRHVLENLEELSVNGAYPMEWVLSHFLLPNLKALALGSMLRPMESYLQGLQLIETYEKLQILQLSRCHFNPTNMLTYLKRMDKLHFLEISSCGSDVGVLLNAMAESGGSGGIGLATTTQTHVICPKLVDIDLSGCTRLTAEPCVRLVKARLQPPSSGSSSKMEKIQMLKLDRCPNLDAALVDLLRSIVPEFSAVVPIEKKKR